MKDIVDLFLLLSRNDEDEICKYLDKISLPNFVRDLKYTYNEWYCEDYEI